MADVPPSKGAAWLLSLDRRWFPCVVEHRAGPLIISEAKDGIRGGMSGSPVLNEAGLAVGVCPVPRVPKSCTQKAVQPRGWPLTCPRGWHPACVTESLSGLRSWVDPSSNIASELE